MTKLSRYSPFSLLVVVAIFFTALVGFPGIANATGTVYFVSDTTQLVPGSIFSVMLRMNTGSDMVNALELGIQYPDEELELISITGGDGAFPIDIDTSGKKGKVTIVRGGLGVGVNGDVSVAKIKFKVHDKAKGRILLGFQHTSVLLGTDNTELAVTTTDGQYVIKSELQESSFSPTEKPGSKIVLAEKRSPDLNDDRRIDLRDLELFLAKWNTGDTESDLSDNGKVEITDLSILLAEWGKATKK